MAVMLQKLLGTVVGQVFAGMAATAQAVTLGITTISFSASGSPNSISGGWNAPGITNADGTLIGGTIEYFTYELTSLTSPFGRPQSISLNSTFSPSTGGQIAYCFNTSVCLADTIVGDVGTVFDPSSTGLWLDQWEFLIALVQGYIPYKTSGVTNISYSSGSSDSINTSGTILVTAYGVAPVLPPAAIPPSRLIPTVGITPVCHGPCRDGPVRVAAETEGIGIGVSSPT